MRYLPLLWSIFGILSAAPLTLRHGAISVRIDPATMTASQVSRAGTIPLLSGGPRRPADVAFARPQAARWNLTADAVTVDAALGDNGLKLTFRSAREQKFRVALAGAGMAKALIVPESEGWYIPVREPFWLRTLGSRPICRPTSGGLSMPFAGIESAVRGTVTYLFGDDVRSELCFEESGGELGFGVSHRFGGMGGFGAFEVLIAPGPDSPIEPARRFRRHLIADGKFVPFAQKIGTVPAAARLLGAMQMYISGRPQSLAVVEGLHKFGLDRAAITYEEDRRDPALTIDPEAIRRAAALGYLIGPYDTFNNIQDPATADGFESVFDKDLFEHGGVMEAPEKVAAGFHNRGHHLSSQALRLSPEHFFEKRVDSRLGQAIKLYFVDVDATGELYDDYDPRHRMTMEQDRQNRIERLKYVAGKGFVTGSESAAAWSAPYLHFTQGPMTPKVDLLWRFISDKERFGGYRPARHPDIHYKEVDAPEDLVTAVFDPRFRLPLYEVVFHDSVVSTDWAGLGLPKLRNVATARSLLSCLYNVPALWWIDAIALEQYGERLKKLNAFFGPLHRDFGAAAMTGFRWLTADRQVQETTFGELSIIANFGTTVYRDIPGLCVQARRGTHLSQYCPAR